MKRRNILRFMILALLFSLLLPVAAEAAMTVQFTNKTTRKVAFALRYKDEVSGAWVTRGWWSVEPLSQRKISVNTNNSVAYWFGSAGKSWWGGKQGASTTKRYGVVGDKFLVKGDNKPSGSNYRVVNFKEVRSENKVFKITVVGD